MDENPYQAPAPTELPKKRPGSFSLLQYVGILALAIVVVIAYTLVTAALAAFNSWLLDY